MTEAEGFPVELFALGGEGTGLPLRVTMTAFGPILLSKVLGLNDTQESSLGLVFHYADKAGLPLLDLADLQDRPAVFSTFLMWLLADLFHAATPNDAKALKQTVNTYPHSAYDDLGKVILSLGIGEAIVTVMNEHGAPTPVAWTRLQAPESLMAPPTPPRWSSR